MNLGPQTFSIEERLRALHDGLRVELPEIVRIAIAVYDHKSDALKTLVHSTVQGEPLVHYEAKLSDVPSLQRLAEARKDRVILDTAVLRDLPSKHSQMVARHWESSYTRPLYEGQRLRGFMFFDASEVGFFSPSIVLRLSVYTELMSLLLAAYLVPARMLHSALEAASEISHERDPETGAHLDRMSRYARLIALGVADRYGFDDVYIERVLLFAPLHDVGKVAIPDSILLKPGRLTDDEMAVMKTHSARGAAMVDRLLARLELQDGQSDAMLHNIIRHHHETWNGNGYPDGLAGEAIPIEARMVTVADVHDALTSERPYKKAWSVDDSFAHLEKHAGTLYDPDCVAAFVRSRAKAESIRQTFVESPGALRFREGYSSDW